MVILSPHLVLLPVHQVGSQSCHAILAPFRSNRDYKSIKSTTNKIAMPRFLCTCLLLHLCRLWSKVRANQTQIRGSDNIIMPLYRVLLV